MCEETGKKKIHLKMEQSYSLVFGELWGILGFGLKHDLNKKSIKNIILMSHIFDSFADDL